MFALWGFDVVRRVVAIYPSSLQIQSMVTRPNSLVSGSCCSFRVPWMSPVTSSSIHFSVANAELMDQSPNSVSHSGGHCCAFTYPRRAIST
jgi:hypothetical protein